MYSRIRRVLMLSDIGGFFKASYQASRSSLALRLPFPTQDRKPLGRPARIPHYLLPMTILPYNCLAIHQYHSSAPFLVPKCDKRGHITLAGYSKMTVLVLLARGYIISAAVCFGWRDSSQDIQRLAMGPNALVMTCVALATIVPLVAFHSYRTTIRAFNVTCSLSCSPRILTL